MTKTEAPTKNRYRRTKSGEWVIYGPAAGMEHGTVAVLTKDLSRRYEQVARLGRTFMVDGVEMVYGYLDRGSQQTISATPKPTQRRRYTRCLNNGQTNLRKSCGVCKWCEREYASMQRSRIDGDW